MNCISVVRCTVVLWMIVSAAFSVDAKLIDVCLMSEVEMKVQFYDKPLHVVENRLTNVGEVPDWYEAYISTFNFIEIGYDRFSELLSEEYKKMIGFDEESYLSSVGQYVTPDIWLDGVSIISEIGLVYDDREFVFIKSYNYELLEEYRESHDLEYATLTTVLEKIDGSWRVQSAESVGWLKAFSMLNRVELEGIVRGGGLAYTKDGQIVEHK